MNLDFNDEQQAFREALRRLLTNKCPPKLVRQMEHDHLGYPPSLWKHLTEMGLPGLTLPESVGGLAQSAMELAITYEEFGRALCPTPHLVSSVIAAGLIARSGSIEQKNEWLTTIAGGQAILTIALLEPGNDYHAQGIQLHAANEGSHYRISGMKYCVPFANAAQRMMTFVRTGPAEHDIDAVLIDPRARGINLRQTQTLAGDPQYVVEFNDVIVPTSERLGASHSGWQHWQAVLPDALIAMAAFAVGCAERAHEMATNYAKERVQFERPIGSFQAIAHPLATVAMEVQGARALVQQAAWVRSKGQPAARLAAMAKLHADFANRHATAVGHQTLGGIGFTIDVDMQLYFRRAKQNQLSWGDPEYLEQMIASEVLET